MSLTGRLSEAQHPAGQDGVVKAIVRKDDIRTALGDVFPFGRRRLGEGKGHCRVRRSNSGRRRKVGGFAVNEPT